MTEPADTPLPTPTPPAAPTEQVELPRWRRVWRRLKALGKKEIISTKGSPYKLPPGPGEPPEVAWFFQTDRRGFQLVLAAFSCLWVLAVLAGFGRTLAWHDRDAWLEQWGEAASYEPTSVATMNGECDSLVLLMDDWCGYQSLYAEELALLRIKERHVQQVDGEWQRVPPPADQGDVPDLPPHEFVDADRDLLVKRFDIDDHEFPGRSDSTYQPGSWYYETVMAMRPHESAILAAYNCDTWPRFETYADYWQWEESVPRPTWSRLQLYSGYVLHSSAWSGDWDAFDAWLKVLYVIADGTSPLYGYSPETALIEVLAQHGYAIPDASLAILEEYLLARLEIAPDLAREVDAWEKLARRRSFNIVLRGKGEGYFHYADDLAYPVFLQSYAMRYPWTRQRVTDTRPLLEADLPSVLQTPGRAMSTIPKDLYYDHDPEYVSSLAHDVVNDINVFMLHRQAQQRLLLAGIGAIRHRRATDAWPTTLDQCLPARYQADPYSRVSAPLALRVDASGALRLWSIGPDGRDDRGIYAGESATTRYAKDRVLRLYWPPAAADPDPISPAADLPVKEVPTP